MVFYRRKITDLYAVGSTVTINPRRALPTGTINPYGPRLTRQVPIWYTTQDGHEHFFNVSDDELPVSFIVMSHLGVSDGGSIRGRTLTVQCLLRGKLYVVILSELDHMEGIVTVETEWPWRPKEIVE